MKKITFEKRIVLAKVTLTLKNFLFSVKTFNNSTIHGDVECYWPKTKKKYLVYIINKLTQKDLEKESFKQTLTYCKANNLKFIIIAFEYDNSLFDYAIDCAIEKEFKIIPYNRLAEFNSEFFNMNSQNPDLTSFLKKEILKSA